MTLPRGYQKRLQKFDPLLRMRWSPSQEVWLLERQYRRQRATWYVEPWSDSSIQARDGYITVGEYAPRELPNLDRLIECLKWSDTWNMGMSANEIADKMDQRWVAEHRKRRAHFKDEVGNRASEAYDTIKWQGGERVAVPR